MSKALRSIDQRYIVLESTDPELAEKQDEQISHVLRVLRDREARRINQESSREDEINHGAA